MNRIDLINKFFTPLECATCDIKKGKFVAEYYGGKATGYKCHECLLNEYRKSFDGSEGDLIESMEQDIEDNGVQCYATGSQDDAFYIMNCEGEPYALTAITDDLLEDLQNA